MTRTVTCRPALLLAAFSLALAACGGGSSPRPPGECSIADTCPQPGGCLLATCVAGGCGVAPRPAGTVIGPGTPGDCHHDVCDGAGAVVSAIDDTDVIADALACTQDLCSAGVPEQTPLPPGTACSQDGGARCSPTGLCVQCLVAAECPGSDDECSHRTCDGAICGRAFTAAGTPVAAQLARDCLVAVCDGTGQVHAVPDDADVPASASACTSGHCAAGVASQSPIAAGAACTGGHCDGAGACVACLAATDCPGTDGACAHRTCTAGACGSSIAAAGAYAADPTPGDCHASFCDGAGNAVNQPYAFDVPADDGNPCTLEVCTSSTPSHPAAAVGTPCAASGGAVCDGAGACVPCNVGADCPSGVCSSHACQAPTCLDLVRNGAETDVDCGGTCSRCGDGKACAVGGDCQSQVCRNSLCASASCTDAVRNGTETDQDCGGPYCLPCALGQACLADRDCASSACTAGACRGPRVTAVTPAAGATDVVPGTAVTLQFVATVKAATLTVQAAAGPCTGTVQLSADGFATCLGISSTSFVYSNLGVVLRPAIPLSGPGTFQVRTTAGLGSIFFGAFQPFTHPGFDVADAGGCGSALVVSQVYPGGGNYGASYANDFVELHNRTGATVSLAGLSLQFYWYPSWVLLPLAGSIPAGGYLLVQLDGVGANGASLPAPDFTFAYALSPSGGYVGLLSNTVAYTGGACPSAGLLDFVGYGATAPGALPCREGTAAAPAPADAGAAVVRSGAGCGDTNDNAFDLVSQLVVPRSSASAPAACACSGTAVNGTRLTVEMDSCSIKSPPSIDAQTGTLAGPVSGQVFEKGVTDLPGPPLDGLGGPAIVGQVGYGPAGTDPRFAAGWTYSSATWNAQAGDSDEFVANFTAPAPGTYAFVYRFSPDGRRWTYCDPDGAGSGVGFAFEPATLPLLTVTP